MISLWILAILVVFALGLGHRAAINLRLARYQRDRLKATWLAKAGINRAIAELEKDTKDTNYDSLTESWSTGKDANGNNIFTDIEIVPGSGEKFRVHVMDEESRINLNNASEELLVTLLTQEAASEVGGDAGTIAKLILIWRGEEIGGLNIDTTDFKKAPFSVPEELRAILDYYYQNKSDQAEYIYMAIKDFLTAYPNNANTDLKININTASKDTLTILAKSVAEGIDSSILITEIQKNTFANQEAIDDFTVSNNPEMQQIYNNIKNFFTYQSNYFKITSEGKVGKITKNITAIYDRGSDKIVYWHEN